MKRLSKWIQKGISLALYLTLFIMLAAFFLMEINGHINGYQLKSVQSGSMEPTIQTGSIIVVRQMEDVGDLQKGDIISFQNKKEQLITHRIDEVVQDGILFKTKGDNNHSADHEIVEAQQIVAQYAGITVPYIGYIAFYIQSKLNIPLFLILSGSLLLLYSFMMFWQIYRHLDQKTTEQKKTAPHA
ncbi:MAG TPA: signal peptidase I [Sporosarcina sp.]|nr:signal peptidase I [Sporosarcina sp.]